MEQGRTKKGHFGSTFHKGRYLLEGGEEEGMPVLCDKRRLVELHLSVLFVSIRGRSRVSTIHHIYMAYNHA